MAARTTQLPAEGQLLVSISDLSMLNDIKKAISMLKGVTAVKKQKTKPRLYDPETGESLNDKTYEIKTYKQYDRDVKLAVRRGLDIEKLLTVVDMLRKDEPLPANLHNHMLSGDYKGYWECHISPDWLLLYEKDTEIRIISLYRTGTHADIFGKGKKR